MNVLVKQTVWLPPANTFPPAMNVLVEQTSKYTPANTFQPARILLGEQTYGETITLNQVDRMWWP